MSNLSTRALAARARATKRWYVYLILCRRGPVYTGIARNVAVRYARHVAGNGARYTRANPPSPYCPIIRYDLATASSPHPSPVPAAIHYRDPGRREAL
jgi:GIY-YIG catalytic domain